MAKGIPAQTQIAAEFIRMICGQMIESQTS